MNNTPDPVTAPNTGFHSPGIDPHALSDDLFDYRGYQVVRREFFAHTQEPALCFCRYQLYVNAACLKKLPTVDHVQVLVNQDTKKLVIRPCGEDEKDSFSWRSQSKTKSRPKRITCRIFYVKIMDLMGWDPESRYKLLGKLIRSNDEQLLLFDLTAPQVFQSTHSTTGTYRTSRIPTFPSEWKSQFGLSVEAHRRSLQIDLFQGYAVFGIRPPARPAPAKLPPVEEDGSEDIWLKATGRKDTENVL